MLCRSVDDDDVPYVILRLGADDALRAEASVQEVDAPESLRLLSGITFDATLELVGDFRLLGVAHVVVLPRFDRRA